jgi:hypothetical protein
MSAVQWGTVSTWVAAVGTVTAVSLALWETRRERKERLRRELMQQAERISAWFVGMHKGPDGGDSHDEKSPRESWLPPELRGRYGDVELLNNSAEPVTEGLGLPVASLVQSPTLVGSRTRISCHDWCASTRAMDN